MDFSYRYKDKDDKTITSGNSSHFLNETDFRSYRRKEMKQMSNVHHCEYYKLGVRNARIKTIANF